MTVSEELSQRVTSIAPWFGGKRTIAPDICMEFGEHRSYWEVPCGSLAVLLAKKPSSHETVVELHGDLINLAMVIASEQWAPVLYEMLQRTLYSDAIFEAAKKVFIA